MTSAGHVARNSIIQLAGRLVTMGGALAILTLLSRYLGPYEFGQYQLVIAFLLLLNVSDFGITTIAIRHLSSSERDQDDVLGNVLTIRIALAVISTVLAIGAGLLLDYSGEATRAIAIASLSFPLNVFAGGYTVVFAAKLRMEYAVIGNIVQAIVTLVLMGAVALAGGGLVRMLIAYDIGFLANSIVCIAFARRFVRPTLRWNPAYAREIARDALPLGVAVLLISVYGRIDVVLLKAFTSSESVGYYGFAYRAVDLAAPMSLMFIGSVFPLLSNHHVASERDDFRRLYQRSQDVLTVLGLGLLTLMILFARPLVDVVGGAKYAPAVMNLRILAMAFGLIWLSNLVDYSLVAIGRQAVLLRIACVGLVVNVSSNLVLIPMFGRNGAAMATVITELAVLLPAIVLLSRYLGKAPSFWVAGRMLPVTLVAGAVVYVLNLPWFEEAAITCALYAVGIAVMRVVSLQDVKLVLRRHPATDAAAVLRPQVEAGAAID